MVKQNRRLRAAANELTVRPVPTAIARRRFERRPQQHPRLNQLWLLDRWPHPEKRRRMSRLRRGQPRAGWTSRSRIVFPIYERRMDSGRGLRGCYRFIGAGAMRIISYRRRGHPLPGALRDRSWFRCCRHLARCYQLDAKTLTVYGIQDGVVRTAAVGIMLQDIWHDFATAVAGTPDGLSAADYLAAIEDDTALAIGGNDVFAHHDRLS